MTLEFAFGQITPRASYPLRPLKPPTYYLVTVLLNRFRDGVIRAADNSVDPNAHPDSHQ